MKKKDNDQSGFESFLKDVRPIKKSNKVKKEVSVRINPTNKKIKENERKIENSFLNFKKKSPQEFQKNTQKSRSQISQFLHYISENVLRTYSFSPLV